MNKEAARKAWVEAKRERAATKAAWKEAIVAMDKAWQVEKVAKKVWKEAIVAMDLDWS